MTEVLPDILLHRRGKGDINNGAFDASGLALAGLTTLTSLPEFGYRWVKNSTTMHGRSILGRPSSLGLDRRWLIYPHAMWLMEIPSWRHCVLR